MHDHCHFYIAGQFHEPVSDERRAVINPATELMSGRIAMGNAGDVDHAVAVANDSPYGLAGYVWGGSLDAARAVAARLRVGQVSINGGQSDGTARFGGYKMSGNGREWGEHGFAEYLETKAVLGDAQPATKAA